MSATILIVEDEADLAVLLRYNLEAEGFRVATATSGDEAVERIRDGVPDLILLDWMLPGLSGIELCRRWRAREETARTPIIMITARGEEEERVRGLATGADDYVVKPPKPMELLARVAALGRRVRAGALPILRLGAFEIDIQRQRLVLDSEPVVLTQKEFDLTTYLFQNPGKLLSRDHLLNMIWGINADVDTRTVDTHISRLRKKLGLDGSKGWKLVPVYGVGYRFERTEPAA